MRKFKIFTTVLLWISANSMLVAQNNAVGLEGNSVQIRLTSDGSSGGANVVGSPYIHDVYLPAKIDDRTENYFARYNAHTDRIEVKLPGGRIIALDPVAKAYKVNLLGVETKTYEAVKYDTEISGYAVLIWKSNNGYALYKKETVEFFPAKESSSSYQESKPATYKRTKDTFYFRSPSSTDLTNIPGSKKKFIEIFPESDMKSYLKAEGLDIKDINDLKAIFEHYYGASN